MYFVYDLHNNNDNNCECSVGCFVPTRRPVANVKSMLRLIQAVESARTLSSKQTPATVIRRFVTTE